MNPSTALAQPSVMTPAQEVPLAPTQMLQIKAIYKPEFNQFEKYQADITSKHEREHDANGAREYETYTKRLDTLSIN